ncbi:hypothetical protein BC829DRAFT_24344 [Chytridium lagenaria]|nr:hypothetical protein BC829DRAFT_24344 [Chytridium lagenaria]
MQDPASTHNNPGTTIADNILLDTGLPKRSLNLNRDNHRRGSSEPPLLRDAFDPSTPVSQTPDDSGLQMDGNGDDDLSIWDGSVARPHSADPLDLYNKLSFNETASLDNLSLMDSEVDLGPLGEFNGAIPTAYLNVMLHPAATAEDNFESTEILDGFISVSQSSGSRDETKGEGETLQGFMDDMLLINTNPVKLAPNVSGLKQVSHPLSDDVIKDSFDLEGKRPSFAKHSFDLPSPNVTPKRVPARELPVVSLLAQTIPLRGSDDVPFGEQAHSKEVNLTKTADESPSKEVFSPDTMQTPSSNAPVVELSLYGLDEINSMLFRRWALCFCVVNFDLEIGQAIEHIYPEIELSESDRRNISFSAFPDSNSTIHVGDSVFAFRFRSSETIQNIYTKLEQGSTESLVFDPSLETEEEKSSHSRSSSVSVTVDRFMVEADGFTYGYVFFRQQKDNEIRRGFFQKSLVLLSPHPWPGLLSSIVNVVGVRFMDALIDDRYRTTSPVSPSSRLAVTPSAKLVLKDVADSIRQWPAPPSKLNPDSTYSPTILTLPLFKNSFAFSIPPSGRFPQLFEIAPSRSRSFPFSLNNAHGVTVEPSLSSVQSSFPDDDVDLADRPRFRDGLKRNISPSIMSEPKLPIICCPGRFYDLFSRSLELLWVCWELIVLGEPVLIMADTPRGCSDVVWGLVELIKPVPFAGDFRPYFTIQDSDFKGIAARKTAPPTGMIVGVTNPFFGKVFENWPHVLRVSRLSSSIGPGVTAHLAHASSSMTASTERKDPQSGGNSPNLGAASLATNRSGSSSGSNLIRSPSNRSVDQMKKPSSPGSPSTVKSFMSSFSKTKAHDKSPSGSGFIVGEGNPIVVESVVQSLTSKHKPFLIKDKKLIKDIAEASIRGTSNLILNNMLRRHFVELTDRFLQPLNRHYEGLIVGSPIGM